MIWREVLLRKERLEQKFLKDISLQKREIAGKVIILFKFRGEVHASF